MKISCLKKDLETALTTVQKVINKNQNLPVIENALFVAMGDELIIKATNLEIFIEYKITVSLEYDGEFLAPIDILLQSIKSSKEDNKKITLELKSNSLYVKDGNSNFSIKTVISEDFPDIKKPQSLKNTNQTINKDILLKGIKSVHAFGSNMLIKPELSSVYLYHEGNDLVFVATDQFRLAEKKINFKKDNFIKNILIPIKNANIIIKILESLEDFEYRFISEENQISLESEHLFISSRVLDISFPDYKTIIPKEFKTKIITLKEDFLLALKKTFLFTDKIGKTKISLESNNLILKTLNKNIGEIEEYIKIKKEGENFSLNINNKYLSEGITAINSDSIELWFISKEAPLLIKGVGDNSFIYILMPMNN